MTPASACSDLVRPVTEPDLRHPCPSDRDHHRDADLGERFDRDYRYLCHRYFHPAQPVAVSSWSRSTEYPLLYLPSTIRAILGFDGDDTVYSSGDCRDQW